MRKIKKIRDACRRENRKPTLEERTSMQHFLDEIDGIERRQAPLLAMTGGLGSLPYDDGYTVHKSDGPFETFGHQLLAIRNAGLPGGQTDQRLFDVRAATGLNEGTPSDGGFLVQSDFSNALLSRASENHPILNMVTRIPMTGNRLELPAEDETSRATGSRHGGVRGYWLAEAAEKQASKPKFRKMTLELNKVVVLVYTTDELLDDAAALDAYLRRVGPDELGWMTQDAVVNGSGAGQPLGLMSAGCLVTTSKETGQAAATIVYENILNMWTRMDARHRKNAIWAINQDVEPQLYAMSLAVGTGGAPVYMPGGGVSRAPYSSLFGRPVVPIEHCQTLGTTGDIILMDPSAYLLADKAPQTDVSIHVRFVYDESVFRFVYRVDGQPERASALTPANGTNTTSPFVALETRS